MDWKKRGTGVAVVTALALLGSIGCSSGGGGKQKAEIDSEQARESLATVGTAYRVAVPLYTALRGMYTYKSDDEKSPQNGDGDKRFPEPGTYDCEYSGSVTVYRPETLDAGGDTLTFEYHECNTSSPNVDYQEPMFDACGLPDLREFLNPEAENEAEPADSSGYHSIIRGTVTCDVSSMAENEVASERRTHAVFSNYQVEAHNNSGYDNRSSWSFDLNWTMVSEQETGDIKKTMGAIPNGTYTLAMNGVSEWEEWDGAVESGTQVTDNTYNFNGLVIEGNHQGAGLPDILTLNGGLKVEMDGEEVLHVSIDEENGGGDYAIDVAFDDLVFSILQIGENGDMNVSISGDLTTKCDDATYSYKTPVTLQDIADIRTEDRFFNRMASAGEMTVSRSDASGEARAVFGIDQLRTVSDATKETMFKQMERPQVEVEADGETETYYSWSELSEGIMCGDEDKE